MTLCRSISKINGDICKIFLPLVFNAPAEGFPWNFVTVLGFEKNRMMPLRECLTICPFVLTQTGIGQTDRQTDRIGKTISRSAYIACKCAIKRRWLTVGSDCDRKPSADELDHQITVLILLCPWRQYMLCRVLTKSHQKLDTLAH